LPNDVEICEYPGIMLTTELFKGRTCFIAAPIDIDIAPVVRSLMGKGVKCQRVDWFDSGISPTSLRTSIRHSDFVLVFSPKEASPNLWFEVGLAIGLGKPIFLVAQQNFLLLSAFRSKSYVRASEWKAEVIEPHLEAFLRTLPVKRLPGSKARRPASHIDLGVERRQARLLTEKSESRHFEALVENLFRKAGLTVTTAPLDDFGADMAVWSPKIQRWLGDPILVEVKTRSTLVDHRRSIEKLSDLIKERRGSAGVYVTVLPIKRDEGSQVSALRGQVPILLLTMNELFDLIESNRFIEAITEVRNSALGHGN
jgi:hypothetical protein